MQSTTRRDRCAGGVFHYTDDIEPHRRLPEDARAMSEPAPTPHHLSEELDRPLSALMVARGVVGGVLMGLANLVPGISGGTMLLASGVYPEFVDAIARLTRLELKPRPIVMLGTIAGSAVVAILLLAGTMRALVVEERWIMYSLFIGLTLGGVPLVWKLARPARTATWVGAALAFAVMFAMAFGGAAGGARDASMGLLFGSGLAGASAMILPGVSGGYLLLLLGQYEPILGAVDQLKQGLMGGTQGPQLDVIVASLSVVIPVGLGVVVGVVGVSNLLRWLMVRHEAATLGALLGLLLGAVVGLYPFQAPSPPEPGFMHHGRVLEARELADVDPKDWPLARFDPTPGQVAASLGLIALGFGATLGVARIGAGEDDDGETASDRGASTAA
jgi:putative membrane protein